jgi:hypothetical protein
MTIRFNEHSSGRVITEDAARRIIDAARENGVLDEELEYLRSGLSSDWWTYEGNAREWLEQVSYPGDEEARWGSSATDAAFESDPNRIDSDEMRTFMLEQGWGNAHKSWHLLQNGRAKDDDFLGHPAWRKVRDEGVPGENHPINANGRGLAFLAMHRHMVQELVQAGFADQVAGYRAQEIDEVVRTQGFGASRPLNEWDAKALDVMNHIEDYAHLFASSDEFGRWVDSTTSGFSFEGEGSPLDKRTSGIHSALHLLFDDRGPLSMQDFQNNIMNREFWRLHGFIDRTWTRFLAARAEPEPVEEIERQAGYMHALNDSGYGQGPSHAAMHHAE